MISALPPGLVRRLREALGETQEQFARRWSVSKPTVVRWETEARQPQPYHAKRLLRLAKRHGVLGQKEE